MQGFKEINGNLIHETAIIEWDVVDIGKGNIIYPYVTIGFDAVHMREKSDGIVKIGNNNVIREYCSINKPTVLSKVTEIGSNNYLMMYSYVAHDCIVEDNTTISNSVQIGGHCRIMKNANIGFGCMIHQFQVIGSYSMLGMGTIVTKKSTILPGNTYVGSPAKYLKKNTIALTRNSIDEAMLDVEINRYQQLRKLN
jgi:UDP-N-acetylglucosamine acyltransferase